MYFQGAQIGCWNSQQNLPKATLFECSNFQKIQIILGLIEAQVHGIGMLRMT